MNTPWSPFTTSPSRPGSVTASNTSTAEAARQARVKLAAVAAVAALVLVVLLVALVWAGAQTASTPSPEQLPVAELPAGEAGPGAAGDGGATAVPPGGWDTAGQAALAARPMLTVPRAAAFPQTLSSRPAGAAIAVPPAALPAEAAPGARVPGGFPATPAGAIGQLAALNTVALTDLNPQTYAEAYRSVSLPGAPEPATTPTGQAVTESYEAAVVGSSEPGPITSRWQLAGAQIKGTTDGGRFLVACVTGELQAVQVRSISVGAGDCQAMRWTGTRWAISPGPVAAPSPATWPGSDAFARAGYRPTNSGSS